MSTPPQAVIISGPNGSGKSTAAKILLPPGMIFLNADMIAQELTGKPGTSADINAGRILLDKIDQLESAGESFAFETTLATKLLSSRVEAWKKSGFEVHLIYFYLASPELAVQRVAQRVRTGGHDVPEETIKRRYTKGLIHFMTLYRDLVDTWRLYDNSGGPEPLPVARGSHKTGTKVECARLWTMLEMEYGQ